MPTVAAELMKDLDLRLLSRSVYETTERLAASARSDIGRFALERQLWWANELLNPQSQYELVRLTPDQYRIATQIRTSISAACFPTVDRRDVRLVARDVPPPHPEHVGDGIVEAPRLALLAGHVLPVLGNGRRARTSFHDRRTVYVSSCPK